MPDDSEKFKKLPTVLHDWYNLLFSQKQKSSRRSQLFTLITFLSSTKKRSVNINKTKLEGEIESCGLEPGPNCGLFLITKPDFKRNRWGSQVALAWLQNLKRDKGPRHAGQ